METPFDRARLDRLMEEAGIALVLATTKHCVQYLLGGYKFIPRAWNSICMVLHS